MSNLKADIQALKAENISLQEANLELTGFKESVIKTLAAEDLSDCEIIDKLINLMLNSSIYEYLQSVESTSPIGKDFKKIIPGDILLSDQIDGKFTCIRCFHVNNCWSVVYESKTNSDSGYSFIGADQCYHYVDYEKTLLDFANEFQNSCKTDKDKDECLKKFSTLLSNQM